MDLNSASVPCKDLYKLMIGLILPRPIGCLAGANTCWVADVLDMPRPPPRLSAGEMDFEGQV